MRVRGRGAPASLPGDPTATIPDLRRGRDGRETPETEDRRARGAGCGVRGARRPGQGRRPRGRLSHRASLRTGIFIHPLPLKDLIGAGSDPGSSRSQGWGGAGPGDFWGAQPPQGRHLPNPSLGCDPAGARKGVGVSQARLALCRVGATGKCRSPGSQSVKLSNSVTAKLKNQTWGLLGPGR